MGGPSHPEAAVAASPAHVPGGCSGCGQSIPSQPVTGRAAAGHHGWSPNWKGQKAQGARGAGLATHAPWAAMGFCAGLRAPWLFLRGRQPGSQKCS